MLSRCLNSQSIETQDDAERLKKVSSRKHIPLILIVSRNHLVACSIWNDLTNLLSMPGLLIQSTLDSHITSRMTSVGLNRSRPSLHPIPAASSSISSTESSQTQPSMSQSSENSPRSSASSLPPGTPDFNPVLAGGQLQTLPLLSSTGIENGSSNFPSYSKTNTSLPDQLPSLNELRFDPSGGPFPVFGKGSHAADPHGLNAYLLHPEDNIWSYLHPQPRTVSGDIKSKNVMLEDETRRKSLGRSPLSGPPMSVKAAPPPVQPIITQDLDKEHAVVASGSIGKSKFGIKLGKKFSKSGVNLASMNEEGSTRPASFRSVSQPVSPLLNSMSDNKALLTSPDEMKLAALSLASEKMEEKQVEDLAKDKEANARWSWFGKGPKHTRKKSGLLTIKTPAKLNKAPEVDAGLSADPLAGVLPSSIPVGSTPAVNDSLHLPARTRSPMPESLRAVRMISIKKMSALRAPSPHPILPETSIPSYMAHHGSESSSSVRLMKFPRSVNSQQLPGMGLGPAEAGMRIDIGVRALLRKIDHEMNLDLQEIKTAGATFIVNGKRMPNGLADAARIKAKAEQSSRRGPGVPAFLSRPGFEDRMVVYLADGNALPVHSDRAVEEIEFSLGLEALGEEATRIAREGRPKVSSSRYSSFDLPQDGRQSWAPIRKSSENDSPEDGSRYGEPETPRPGGVTPTQGDMRPSLSLLKFPSGRPCVSVGKPAASRANTNPIASPIQKPVPTNRRSSTINWRMASDSESDEESEEEESEDERQPLSSIAASRQRPLTTSFSAPLRPNLLSRPASLVAPKIIASGDVSTRPAVDPRVVERRMKNESEMAARYREQVMQSRERRDQARVGVVERERQSEAMREKERERRRSALPGTIDTHAARSLPVASAPVSPNHTRTTSGVSSVNTPIDGQMARSKRQSIADPSNKMSPADFNRGLSRRSMSYADVRTSMHINFPPPLPFMPHSMSFSAQPQVMYVPVPVMPFPQSYMPMMQAPMGLSPSMPTGLDRQRRKSYVMPSTSNPTLATQRRDSNLSQQHGRQPTTKRHPVQ
jgi:hypothetical protein